MFPQWVLAGLIAGAVLQRLVKGRRRRAYRKGEGKGDLPDVRYSATGFGVERASSGELLQSIEEEEMAEDSQAEAVDSAEDDGEPCQQQLNGVCTSPELSGASAASGLPALSSAMNQNVEPLEIVDAEESSSVDPIAMPDSDSPEEQTPHTIGSGVADVFEVRQGNAESDEANEVVIDPGPLNGPDSGVDNEGQDDQEARADVGNVLPSAHQSASQENGEASSTQAHGEAADDMERSPEQPAAAPQSPAPAGGQEEGREASPPPSGHKVLRPRVSPPLVRVGLTVPSPLEHQRPGLAGLLKDRDFDRHSSAYGVRLWMVTPDMASRL
ncbi:hypothetical protein KFL_003390060 [Klebsormidium nitens]|uniref:Uncharacterized protein n=1 Tax=Klebsormidium nitens TaxID=105231 RepID=A0A1Y1IEQ3_KLENI|nr:hypothetical protein KFL_003390060 [Klebsormidium nitens]|eukprot:GAQ87216.1 hypothetical protein KFL_003390060 [Klebsormidium nitens]